MIDKQTIEHIARLARLEINSQEAQEYSQQLSSVLQHFEQISKVETGGVEPLITPSEIEEFCRHDEVKRETTAEEIVANAPQRTGNLFTVPPVV